MSRNIVEIELRDTNGNVNGIALPKTISEAVEYKNEEPVPVDIGGVKAGTIYGDGTTVDKVIKDLINPRIAPVIKSCSVENQVSDDIVTITTIDLSILNVNTNIKSISVYVDGNLKQAVEKTINKSTSVNTISITLEDSISVETSATISIRIMDNENQYDEYSAEIYIVNPIYAGLSDIKDITSDIATTNNQLSSKDSLGYIFQPKYNKIEKMSLNIDTDNETKYLYIAVPKTNIIKSITDQNGLDITNVFDVKETLFDTNKYSVYTYSVNVSNFGININF